MFQKYYGTNITTNFIKNLLASNYIPDVPVWKPGKPVINNGFYITQDYILKAINPFIPGESQGQGPTNQLDANYFDVVDRYLENSYNHGYCNKYNSYTSYYDSKTHYYLGQYLRLQRDMYNLDLMAYYNCWCGEYSDKIRIYDNFNITDKNTEKDGLKVLLVPIKYNQKYTIYINSNSNIIIQPVLIANNKIISGTGNKTKFKNNTEILYSSNFYNPYVYKGLTYSNYIVPVVEDVNQNLSSQLEKYLYLAIQVSELVSSHIVILEGDYSNNKLFSFGSFGYNTSSVTNKLLKTYFGPTPKPTIDNPSPTSIYLLQDEVNRYCRTSPGLIRTIDNSSYAFDDRLLEYLLLNVIDNNDEISDNIKKVQDYITSSDNTLKNKIRTYDVTNTKDSSDNIETDITFKTQSYPLYLTSYSNYLPGVWDNQMRMYLYDLITQHWKTPKTVNISGYVDKDVESIIGDNN